MVTPLYLNQVEKKTHCDPQLDQAISFIFNILKASNMESIFYAKARQNKA